jgi:hypothetical protein
MIYKILLEKCKNPTPQGMVMSEKSVQEGVSHGRGSGTIDKKRGRVKELANGLLFV